MLFNRVQFTKYVRINKILFYRRGLRKLRQRREKCAENRRALYR